MMLALRETRAKIGLFLFFVLVTLLTRAVLLPVEVFDIDETAHAVGSWEFLSGKLVYTDFVNNKPPLLYVYYALAQLIFGKGLFAVHLFTALFTIPLTAVGVSAFYRHGSPGLIGALTYLIYSASFLAHDMHASHTEVLMMLPGTWAIVLINDREHALKAWRAALACFLIGLGFLMKFQIAFWLGTIGLMILYQCIRTRAFGRLFLLTLVSLAGFALPLAVTYVAFATAGGEKWMLYWTILNNLGYSANPITAREALGRAASYCLPFLIATAPLWWFSLRSLRQLESRYHVLLISSLLFLSIPPTLLGFRFYPHYFIQLYVPLAIGAGPYLATLLQKPLSGAARVFLGYTAILFFGFTIANAFLYYGNRQVYRETDPVFPKVAARLKSDPCYANGTMFVWGYAPILYYYSELPAASRFVVLPQSYLTGYISGNLESVRGKMSTRHLIKEEHWDLLMEDLEKNQATYILDTSPAGIYRWNYYPIKDYPRLQNYLNSNYRKIEDIDRILIYRRKTCDKLSRK